MQEQNQNMKQAKIVDIPFKMEKFFGKGKMLHPTIEAVEALIETIPKGSVATINSITKRLSKDFQTDVTCPLRTGNAIKKIAAREMDDNFDQQIPYWRVITSNKLIIKSKKQEFAASQIQNEGFELTFTKAGSIQVDVDNDKIFTFQKLNA